MNNRDTKITKVYEGKYGDFSVTLCIKSEDITPEQKTLFRAFWTSGETLDIDYKPHTAIADNQSDLVEELEKKEVTFDYNDYRLRCGNYGIDYNGLKKDLKVEHLKDLENKMTVKEVATLLENELQDRLNLMNYWNN